MTEMYDELKGEITGIEKNPVEKEIKQILVKYKKVTKEIDNQASSLMKYNKKGPILDNLKSLRKRADSQLKELAKSAENFARIAAPKSELSGRKLADAFIRKQRKIITDEGEVIKLFDVVARDKEAIRKVTESVTQEMLREVNMINSAWRKNFDDVIREGIKEARSLQLTKQPGIRGGTTTKDQIGSQLYQKIKDSGLKLEDSIGRKWDPERYVRMYSRTRSRELQTQGIENRMNDYGFDLVKISEHVDVDGMDICNDYEGNVYSLSGDHPNYPALLERPPFHPNCAHVMTPWIERYNKHKK
ncbi:MAG TPA: phage minor capsid protein [Clostridia bacterium]|nr:phage minor capsid protein [Clostridia bacterium]